MDKCGLENLQTINFVHNIDTTTGPVLTEWGGGSIFLDGEDRMIEIRSNNKIRYLKAKISHITLEQAGPSPENKMELKFKIEGMQLQGDKNLCFHLTFFDTRGRQNMGRLIADLSRMLAIAV